MANPRKKKSAEKASEYAPPYTVTDAIVSLVGEISAALERYKIAMEGPEGVRLRRINHVKTLRGTTAIEGNSLSEEQITAVLEGRRVVAPRREIDEIKGAHKAYELLGSIDPYSVEALLRVHAVMMENLVENAGHFRTSGVGVVDGAGNVLHVAPPADRVPGLVADILDWVKTSPAHPLVKTSVFHCEFEFIHPFPDGNGRMGRFLQTAMLGEWNDLFYAAPVENIVFENQAEYYKAINVATAQNDSAPFVTFMLERILETIREKGTETDVPINVPINVPIKNVVLELVKKTPGINRAKMADILKVNVRTIGRVLAQVPEIEHRGSKKAGGYFCKGNAGSGKRQ